jgi:1-acyl-sn-glycerol-3-phosphate acyltransferase
MKSKSPNRILRFLHAIFLILWIVVSTVIFATSVIIFRPVSRWISVTLMKLWMMLAIFFSGVKVKITGTEKIDRKRSYVFMSNHISAADIAILYAACPVSISFLAKRELFFVPFFGWGIAAGGHIPINRSNPKSARRSIDRAVRLLSSGKTSLAVFPEGTRSRTGEMGEFKLGVFSLAIQAGTPVVPVAIRGSRQILPKGSYFINPAPVTVSISDPISVSGFDRKNKGVLAKIVRDRIEELLKQRVQ